MSDDIYNTKKDWEWLAKHGLQNDGKVKIGVPFCIVVTSDLRFTL